VEVLDRLLSGRTERFEGEFTTYDHAEVSPGCIQSPGPPLVVAASGKRTDPTTLRRSLLLQQPGGSDPWARKGAFMELVERYSALGFTDFIAFSPQEHETDVLDHVTTEVLPALRAQAS
jgi:hypothetical protein